MNDPESQPDTPSPDFPSPDSPSPTPVEADRENAAPELPAEPVLLPHPISGSSEPSPGSSETIHESSDPLASTPQILSWPAPHDPLAQMQPVEPAPVTPPQPRLYPHIGHVLVFLLLVVSTALVSLAATLLGLHFAFPKESLPVLAGRMTQSAARAVIWQVVWYGMLWASTALVFGVWWKVAFGSGFSRGIHWNASAVPRKLLLLMGAGIVTGVVITLAGNFLPMPKSPEILKDIMQSSTGAWLLMVFGVTVAPLTEELAFRGFLLPSLINVFRWLERQQALSEEAVRLIGVPVSVLITSALFALMHSPQVQHSWGPVLLIGCVSVILCIVRLRTNSVACGIIVHSFYNLTLFMGLLIQTDGFRHLEKLNS